jgi:hypothetical protein
MRARRCAVVKALTSLLITGSPPLQVSWMPERNFERNENMLTYIVVPVTIRMIEDAARSSGAKR